VASLTIGQTPRNDVLPDILAALDSGQLSGAVLDVAEDAETNFRLFTPRGHPAATAAPGRD